MGVTSSIHFKRTKNKVQTQHNDRTIPPGYLLDVVKASGGIEVNRDADQAEALKSNIISKAMQAYQAHRGQNFRAKSYLWSAVVNIKDTSTMQDLEKLAAHFKTKYGFQCYQIAIHRDEGYKDEQGNIRINHHAHMEFVTLDEQTGKSLFRKQYITNKVLRQIQTETANILGMQRGEDVRKTGRKRIEPRAYGKLMNETRQKHEAVVDDLNEELKDSESNYNKLACFVIEVIKLFNLDKEPIPENTTLDEAIDIFRSRFQDLQASNANTQTQLNTAQQENTTLQSTNTTLTQENQKLETSNKKLETQLEELKTTNTELNTQLEELIAIVAPTDKKQTAKQLKALKEQARQQMIVINNLFGEDKLFTKEDYAAIRALGTDNLDKNVKQIVSKALERFEKMIARKEGQVWFSGKAMRELAMSLLKNEITKLTQQLENTKQELTTLKTTNANLETTRAKEVKDLKEQHAKEVNNLKQEHSKEIEDLKSNSALKDKQNKQLENQNAELQKQKEQLEALLENQNAELQEELEQNAELQEELEQKELENEQLKKDNVKLAIQVKNYKDMQKGAEMLSARLSAYQAKEAATLNHVENLEATILKLQDQAKRIENRLEAMINRQKSTIEQLETENAELKQQPQPSQDLPKFDTFQPYQPTPRKGRGR